MTTPRRERTPLLGPPLNLQALSSPLAHSQGPRSWPWSSRLPQASSSAGSPFSGGSLGWGACDPLSPLNL